MNQNNSFKNFSYVSIGRISGLALQAIFYFLFASLLDPESYGELGYIIALAGTVSLVSRFGLNHTVIVYRAKENSDLSNQVNTLVVISCSIAAIILVFIDEFAALLALALSFFIMNQHNLLGQKKYKKFMFNSISRNILFLIIPIPFYFILDIPGVVLGIAIANFLGSVLFFKNLKLRSFFELKNRYKEISQNFGVDASQNLSRMVDKLLIAPLFGFFIVGIYQFNLQILFVLEILPNALHSFLLSEESSGSSHKKLNTLIVVISLSVAILAIFFSPFFVNEFFPKYSEGIFSLQILVLTVFPLSISSIFTAKLQSKQYPLIGYSAIVRIGALLILILLLGEWYGLAGLSMAFLFSVIINTFFLAGLYIKSNKIK